MLYKMQPSSPYGLRFELLALTNIRQDKGFILIYISFSIQNKLLHFNIFFKAKILKRILNIRYAKDNYSCCRFFLFLAFALHYDADVVRPPKSRKCSVFECSSIRAYSKQSSRSCPRIEFEFESRLSLLRCSGTRCYRLLLTAALNANLHGIIATHTHTLQLFSLFLFLCFPSFSLSLSLFLSVVAVAKTLKISVAK